jgi:ribonuclease R
MTAHGLVQDFSDLAKKDAREAVDTFNPDDLTDREDLTGLTVVTIDPESARDYDDAISIEPLKEKGFRLGVHIADVSHFVKKGSALDDEAYKRGTSVYFPRHVVPMLPPSLSNGICSLQEGVKRFTKTVFIDYNSEGQQIAARLVQAVVISSKRLTYKEAQSIIDGEHQDFDKTIVNLLLDMNNLAKKIEQQRMQRGMLHLNLPETELVLDDAGAVVDARPVDSSYTHKIIEMFMVEANDAVAKIFYDLEIPLMRRIHIAPDEESFAQLAGFAKACGEILSDRPTRKDIQRLIENVKDTPKSYAMNLATLRTFQRAVYSTEIEEHYALASPHYCHFTSPIRRYPDLTVHRKVEELLKKKRNQTDDQSSEKERLSKMADFLSTRERISQTAEMELKLVLILNFLKTKTGELFDGIITGVTDFGIFVQNPVFLIEGLIRLADLGDDWWEVISDEGKVAGDLTGKVFKIGDTFKVRIDSVDIAKRQLNLSPSYAPPKLATGPDNSLPVLSKTSHVKNKKNITSKTATGRFGKTKSKKSFKYNTSLKNKKRGKKSRRQK